MTHEDPDYPLEATVKLERNTYERLKIIVKRKEKDIKNTVNCMVKNYVNREYLFELYKPFLYIVTSRESSLFIKDDKVNKLVEIILKYRDSKTNDVILYCQECDSDYCVHTAFALGANELGLLELKIRNHHSKK